MRDVKSEIFTFDIQPLTSLVSRLTQH